MPKITLRQNEIKSALAKQLARFPYFDSTELNNAVNVLAPGGYLTPQYPLGSTFELLNPDGFAGASFQFVKLLANSTTLAAGNVVEFARPLTGTITATGSTTSAIKTNIDLTNYGNLAGQGAVLSIQDASTPIITMRRIISTTTSTNAVFTIATAPDSLVGNQTAPVDALSAVPTNGQPVEVLFPNQVAIYPTTGFSPPAGIALGAVTAGAATVGNYTLIQKSGVALVLAVGSGTAITSGDPVIPSGATAGVVIGTASASAVAVGIAQRAWTSTAQLIPVLLGKMLP